MTLGLAAFARRIHGASHTRRARGSDDLMRLCRRASVLRAIAALKVCEEVVAVVAHLVFLLGCM